MNISPDVLKDFIDGKLGHEEASAVAASIAGDPDLAAYVEDQKALKTALASPAAVWLRGISERVAARGANWIPVFAMAAGIGLGVLLSSTFGMGSDLRSQDGTLIAQGALAQSLSTALAGEQNTSPVAARITASFWSKNGSFCRNFVTRGSAESALAGIACRERGAWRIAAMATMAPITPLQAPAVTEALPPSVRGVMDNLIVGQPLDPDEERQIRNQGWRAR